MLDARTLGRIADAESVAPAVVSRAADVVRSIDGQFDPPGAARAVAWLVDQSLEAQGHAPLRHADAARLPEQYDPALMRADADLAQVAAGLAATRAARLCLYGPPGTGKTAWGRWLAQQLDMPLMLRRASDLMSKWVGDSEKNIARAFRQAEAAGALLMIDEVDSFLQERTHASHGWEVSMVNEMLTRIETFSGLFIASTNLMSGLDTAALRRFDLKVRFDFLLPAQAEALLARYAATLALALAEPDAGARLRRLAMLTPGDFAAVARQHRFRPMASADAFIAALEQECALKAPAGKTIGFLV